MDVGKLICVAVVVLCRLRSFHRAFQSNLKKTLGCTVTLKREYQGETIVVEVRIHADDLVVRISKSRGPCLEFGCFAYLDKIIIHGLSVKDPDISDDQIAYEGPEFTDLNGNLQKAFHKYLEIRGVEPSTTNFLNIYMLNKESRERVMWLKNLKKFLEA